MEVIGREKNKITIEKKFNCKYNGLTADIVWLKKEKLPVKKTTKRVFLFEG